MHEFTRSIGRFVGVGALGAAGVLAGCAAPPGERPAEVAAAAGVDPYPGVNTVGQDRAVWTQLLSDHRKIRRTVVYTADGVEATTESDDPTVAARIKNHAKAMQARMKVGARVRVWDPVFAELFERHGSVRLEVAETARGVSIVERADNPQAAALLWSHAAGVSEFVRRGHEVGDKATVRIAPGVPPPAEVAIGGVRHRVLLGQPDAAGLAVLRASGVTGVVNFRRASEHPAFDESAACEGAGLSYANPGYRAPAELTDALIDGVREELRRAEAGGGALALHCRTGNRVGPAWIAWRALDGGVPLEQAVSEAKSMRMVDAELERIAREYVQRRAAKN